MFDVSPPVPVDCESEEERKSDRVSPLLDSFRRLTPGNIPLRAPVALQIIDGFWRGSGVERESTNKSSCPCVSRQGIPDLFNQDSPWVSGLGCGITTMLPLLHARSSGCCPCRGETPSRPSKAPDRAQSSTSSYPSADARLAGPSLGGGRGRAKQAARQPQAGVQGGNDVKHPWWRASAQHREVLSLCWSMPSVGPVGGGNAALDLDLDLPGTLEGWRRDEDGETDGNRQCWDARNQTVCIAVAEKKKSWGQ